MLRVYLIIGQSADEDKFVLKLGLAPKLTLTMYWRKLELLSLSHSILAKIDEFVRLPISIKLDESLFCKSEFLEWNYVQSEIYQK